MMEHNLYQTKYTKPVFISTGAAEWMHICSFSLHINFALVQKNKNLQLSMCFLDASTTSYLTK